MVFLMLKSGFNFWPENTMRLISFILIAYLILKIAQRALYFALNSIYNISVERVLQNVTIKYNGIYVKLF